MGGDHAVDVAPSVFGRRRCLSIQQPLQHADEPTRDHQIHLIASLMESAEDLVREASSVPDNRRRFRWGAPCTVGSVMPVSAHVRAAEAAKQQYHEQDE